MMKKCAARKAARQSPKSATVDDKAAVDASRAGLFILAPAGNTGQFERI
jgi:hypothetical protein